MLHAKVACWASKLTPHVQAQTDRLQDVVQTYTAAIQGPGCMPGRGQSEMSSCGSWPWTHYYFGAKARSPDVAYLQRGTSCEAVPISTG